MNGHFKVFHLNCRNGCWYSVVGTYKINGSLIAWEAKASAGVGDEHCISGTLEVPKQPTNFIAEDACIAKARGEVDNLKV